MSIIKSAFVAAALASIAATAHAQSREDLNSGYHGNSPVYSSPYGPTDEIERGAGAEYDPTVARVVVAHVRERLEAERAA